MRQINAKDLTTPCSAGYILIMCFDLVEENTLMTEITI